MNTAMLIILIYIAIVLMSIYARIKKAHDDIKVASKAFSFHQGVILGMIKKIKEAIEESRPLH